MAERKLTVLDLDYISAYLVVDKENDLGEFIGAKLNLAKLKVSSDASMLSHRIYIHVFHIHTRQHSRQYIPYTHYIK